MSRRDDGSATLELVSLSVLLLLPVLWAVVAVVRAESVSFAAREAARDAARAFVTGASLPDAERRARAAARLAFADQGLDASPAVTFRLGRSCAGPAEAPLSGEVRGGTDITACLSVDLALPMLERIGRVVHLHAAHTFTVDEHRSALR